MTSTTQACRRFWRSCWTTRCRWRACALPGKPSVLVVCCSLCASAASALLHLLCAAACAQCIGCRWAADRAAVLFSRADFSHKQLRKCRLSLAAPCRAEGASPKADHTASFTSNQPSSQDMCLHSPNVPAGQKAPAPRRPRSAAAAARWKKGAAASASRWAADMAARLTPHRCLQCSAAQCLAVPLHRRWCVSCRVAAAGLTVWQRHLRQQCSRHIHS